MKNADLLVDLYQLVFKDHNTDLNIKRALSPDSDAILAFIKTYFSEGWVSEAKASLYKTHPTCFIAVDQKKVVGFACYDATAKGFFGPMGVHSDYRKKGIGRVLVLKCMEAMRHDGYGYAIIGSVEAHNFHFYQEACQATPIENSTKIYQRMIHRGNH
ncbi:MAG: GNAT family N-acetyltransferase [Acholeplasmataceae bacterium]